MTDHARRQKVLQQLNSQLQSRRTGSLDLGVTGSKLPLLEPNKCAHEIKLSKIPRPSTPSRPLPPPGYVSDTLTAHRHTPIRSHQHTPTALSTSNGRRQLTVVIHGLPQSDSSEEKLKTRQKPATLTHVVSKQSREVRTNEKAPEVSNRKQVLRKEKDKSKMTVATRVVREKGMSGSNKSRNPWESRKARLEELKRRYLARKYGRLWISKVYGRIHPSTARAHHAHTLVRSVWRVWCGEWWAARREWKLNIRAECHDRYRLWQLVWNAWIHYTTTCREKKRLCIMADQFSSTRLTHVVWSGWCEYVNVRRVERDEQTRAKQWRTTQLIRCAWLQWRRGVECVRQRRTMETLALHHWAHRLTEQVWQHWLVRLHTRQVLRVHEDIAVRHYHQTLTLNTWAVWLDYVQVRRDKKAMKGLAVSMYCSRLLSRTFEGWQARLERAQEIAQFQELIVERGRMAVKRRAFQYWRLYISLCWYKDHLIELSVQFNQFSLKRRALHRLKGHCEQQQREAANGQLAKQHRTGKLLLRCWGVWLHGCEHREEIKMGPQTRTAQHHFSQVVNKKVLVAWVQYTLHRRERERLKRMADQQFKTNALPRCFRALRVNVEVQLYQRELSDSANEFRRETLLSMVFYKWWRDAQFSQDLRMLERVAILHNEEVQKRQLLTLWRTRTRQRVRHLAKEASAVTHYRVRKMGVAFHKWQSRLQGLITRRQQLCRASDHYGNKLVGVVWSAWKTYIAKRRFSKERRAFADAHYTKVISHKLTQAWKTYVLQCRDKKAILLTAHTHFSVILKRRVLHLWMDSVCVAKTERELGCMADTHFKIATLKKYLSMWLNRTAESIDDRQQEEELLQQSTQHLIRVRLSRILLQWRDYSVRARCVKLASQSAEAHHAIVLKRKCFDAWWGYQRRRLRGALLARQGEWFLRNRLISACYSQWRVQFMHSLVMKQKSISALWHWSLWLQRRCLAAWLLHTLERSRKRERYALALDRHRRRLVTLGVTQWIKVATQMQAQREAIALQHQTKNAQTVLKCVRRCASHWLTLTRRRRLYPQAPRKPREGVCKGRSVVDGEPAVRLAGGDGGNQGAGDWNSLLKSLQLADGSRKDRPQPRRPIVLSHPHIALPPQLHTNTHPHSDVQPRHPLIPAPQQQTQTLQQSSYTFLTSTCTEPSRDESTDSTQETYTVESPLLHCSGLQSGENLLFEQPLRTDRILPHQSVNPHPTVHFEDPTRAGQSPGVDTQSLRVTSQRVADPQRSIMQLEQLSQTRTAPTQQPVLGTHQALSESTQKDARCRTIQHRTSGRDKQSDLPPSLANPSVQRELVQIRDTLKHFHQLKTKQRILEGRLSSLTEQGNTEECLKAKQELASLSANITSKEPMIKQCALRLNQLLTQSGLNQ